MFLLRLQTAQKGGKGEGGGLMSSNEETEGLQGGSNLFFDLYGLP